MNRILIVRTAGYVEPKIKMLSEILCSLKCYPIILLLDRGHTENRYDYKVNKNYIVYRIKFPLTYSLLVIVLALPFWCIVVCSFVLIFRPKVIHAADFPSVIPAIFAGRFSRSKVVYDILDFYKTMIPKTKSRIFSLFKSLIELIESACVASVDLVFLAHDFHYKIIGRFNPKKTVIAYHVPEYNQQWLISLKDSYKSHNLQSRTYDLINSQSLGPNDPLILFYSGILSKERGLYQLVNTLKEFNDNEVKCIIIGYGPEADWIKSQAKKMSNLHFFGFVEREEMIKYELLSDVIYISYDPSVEVCRVAVPSKLYEAMILEKPVIVSLDTNASRLVELYKFGISINYNNVKDLKEKLIFFTQNRDFLYQLGKNGRRAYEMHYNHRRVEHRIARAYKILVS